MSARQSRGFIERMNDWLTGSPSQNDMISSMSRPYSRPSYYYDYYDDGGGGYPSSSRLDSFGSPSGHGGYCYEDQVSLGLLVTALSGIVLMWYTLYVKVKANGGRRRRETTDYWNLPSFEYVFGGAGRLFYMLQPYLTLAEMDRNAGGIFK